MKIAKGFVQNVLDRGDGDKVYAIVGIGVTTKNRNGFESTSVMEFQIRGQDHKNGLQNAYRSHIGSEVYAPFSDEIDTFYKDNPRIRYNLQGPPLRLSEQVPEQRPSALKTAGA